MHRCVGDLITDTKKWLIMGDNESRHNDKLNVVNRTVSSSSGDTRLQI